VAPALPADPAAPLELVVRGVGLWSYAADQLGSPLRLEREVSFGDS
jgi:hypothetical protein